MHALLGEQPSLSQKLHGPPFERPSLQLQCGTLVISNLCKTCTVSDALGYKDIQMCNFVGQGI